MPDCIHLEKRADLMEQSNIPKLWSGGTQALSPPQLTCRRKRNGVGREWRPGTAEYLTLEICSGSTNLHFMVLAWYSCD